jgi:1-acyl-sn-glycerol-3-phosphate acyltransferase
MSEFGLKENVMLYYVAWLILQPLKIFLNAQGLNNITLLVNYFLDQGLEGAQVGMIVTANHKSALDPWKIGIFLPFKWAVRWFAKKELFHPLSAAKEFNPWLAPFTCWIVPCIVRYSLTIIVDKVKVRARENILALRLAQSLLEAGKIIGIFPRGTIYETDEVNSSFVSLAIRTNSIILPVFVLGREIQFGGAFSLVPALCKKSDYKEIAQEIIGKIEMRHRASEGES